MARRSYKTDAENLGLLLLWEAEVLSEGQVAKALDIDRVTLRMMREGALAEALKLAEALVPAPDLSARLDLAQESAKVGDARLCEQMQALQARLAEWEKLKDPVALHVNLLLGFPCQLDRETFLHLAGHELPSVKGERMTTAPRGRVGQASDADVKPNGLPANRLPNLLRRVERARRFPHNTCPASRHVYLMARAMLTRHGYPMLTEEPEHCAGSLLSVLESLWKARTRAIKLKGARDEA